MSARWLPICLMTAVLAAVTGCDDAAGEDSAEAWQPLQGGVDDATTTAVVQVFRFDAGVGCSGTLLAPNLVLTARHCAADVEHQVNGGVDCAQTTFGANGAPEALFISTMQTMPLDLSGWRAVREIVSPAAAPLCGNDVALLILEELVDPSEATPLVPRIEVEAAAGEVYSAVGFGGTDDDGTSAGRRRRLDDQVVQCVDDGCPEGALSREWVGDDGACLGDSGGPAIDEEGRVFGVVSRGEAGCTRPIHGSVAAWGEWIAETAQHAAELGEYTAPSWATGSPIHQPPIDPPVPSEGAHDGGCATHGNGAVPHRTWLVGAVVAALAWATARRRRRRARATSRAVQGRTIGSGV